MAEGVGFEPTVGCPTAVFKTAAIDHSATPPTRYKSQVLKKIGECLYRNGNGTSFAILKIRGHSYEASNRVSTIVLRGVGAATPPRRRRGAPHEGGIRHAPREADGSGKIYQVEDGSPNDQVLITSANLDLHADGMNAREASCDARGFVYFTKGGGIRTRQIDAKDPGTFPSGTPEGGSVPYRYVTLK